MPRWSVTLLLHLLLTLLFSLFFYRQVVGNGAASHRTKKSPSAEADPSCWPMICKSG
jgi:hypothetical protein